MQPWQVLCYSSETGDGRDALLEALEKALDDYQTVKPDIDRLTSYLETNAWRDDFEADEAGLVPKDLKRGVLSEDGLYDLLTDIVRVNQQMQDICA